MNKIAILTFHQCINYGAILQTFALQQYLKENGSKAFVIDYRNSVFEKMYTWRRFFVKQKIFYAAYNYFTLPFWLIKKRRFDIFKSKYIDFCDIDSKFEIDKYVVGSDQVWNLKTTGDDYTYFLNFLSDNSKKYSYAASFGVEKIDDKHKKICSKYLNSFEKISVREMQAKSIVDSISTNKATVVLDPTFLLNKESWSKYSSKKRIKKKYILIYQLAYSKKLIEFAKRIAKEKNLRIITIDGNPRQFIKAKYVLDAGPQEWLNLFINAEYVVTNSFHGLAFSINLNKNFYFEYLGNGLPVNSRLKNISNIFDLESRNIENNLNEINYDMPDYDRINKILDIERKKSYKWIKDNLIEVSSNEKK